MKNILLIGLASLYLVGCGFEVVDTGRRGIKTRFGEVVGEPLPEGLHFYNPITSNIIEYPVREDTWTHETSVFTKDTQSVSVTFAVTVYPDPKSVTKLYREIGDYDDLIAKIIKPVVLGSLKDAIGGVVADELVSKREIVRAAAEAEMKTNLGTKNVFVTGLNFSNLDFDDAYEKAVEEKVVAIQNAQKAKNETVRINEQALQTVKMAEAQATAMKIQSEALAKNKGLTAYEIAKRWNGVLPNFVMGNAIPMLDMSELTRQQAEK